MTNIMEIAENPMKSRHKITAMGNNMKNSVVLANNDVIYLWWSISKKIKDCLGFSIHRVVKGKEDPKGLYATVGFDIKNDKRKSPQTTDEWPIQSFNWKDLYAPKDVDISYKIYPMIGAWNQLSPDKLNAIQTQSVRRTKQYGDIRVIFNRGILSTQAFAHALTGKKMTPDLARELITNQSSDWRNRLGGQMLEEVKSFFNRATNAGGKYYAALYELTDDELIQELTKSKGTEIILSNANSSKYVIVDGKRKSVSINDGTNKNTRKALHKLKNIIVYDRMLGTHIGHNKFVIYVDNSNKPISVLTGSTNWTPTGLCGQTNNMAIFESEWMAKCYLEYWGELRDDIPVKQGPTLRTWCAQNSTTNKINGGSTSITLWYSPNTKQKTKPKNAKTPRDMEEIFQFIGKAKESLLFLVFNPGSPSIIDEIKKVSANRSASKPPLYVRGAVSDAKLAASVTTNIFTGDINKKPDTYYFDRITGVSAIPDDFSYFEEELLKLGFATSHDKILVIDPFDDECVVVTGSHNLGYAASYKNDENLLIIRNNKSIAQAYATHVLDVVNHFKWRYKLQDKIKKANAKTLEEKIAATETGWKDLDEYDIWMNYYFNSNGFINRDKFLYR
jgi:phosphatidylserine/phosphatidylglycerophosphate/cardiolipin synthase-like enzyme